MKINLGKLARCSNRGNNLNLWRFNVGGMQGKRDKEQFWHLELRQENALIVCLVRVYYSHKPFEIQRPAAEWRGGQILVLASVSCSASNKPGLSRRRLPGPWRYLAVTNLAAVSRQNCKDVFVHLHDQRKIVNF